MPTPDSAAPWCWAMHRGATCLIAAPHDGNHAGPDWDGNWLRWTDEESTRYLLDELLAEVEAL